jgi:hypothetical protein
MPFIIPEPECMKINYYVYYRCAAEPEEVCARIRAMQQELAQQSGIAGQLLRRCEDTETWMEIYPDISDAGRFEAALTAAVTAHRLDELLQSGTLRHIERFQILEQAHSDHSTV